MRTQSQALKIRWFQDLYKMYSRLELTNYSDRPIAIKGLEMRLLRAFGTKGGYGIFDDGESPEGGLFHRSLLWRRGKDEARLEPINFPIGWGMRLPSWSWMAYKGGIDYMDPPFGAVDWERKEVVPPWTRGRSTIAELAPEDDKVALTATVRAFSVAGRRAGEAELVYDIDMTGLDGQRPQCIIVAKSKDGRAERDKMCHVLLVGPTRETTGRGEKVYKRVGVGVMLGKYIDLEAPGTIARIY